MNRRTPSHALVALPLLVGGATPALAQGSQGAQGAQGSSGSGPTASATANPPIATGELDRWSLWWDLNREPYLAVKDAVRSARTVSGSGEPFLGRGQTEPPLLGWGPAPDVVVGSVVPALRRVLDESENVEVVTACLMALAEIGGESASDCVTLLRPYLKHPNQDVRETAAIALGVLADASAAPELVELLHDTRAGRRASGGAHVDYRTRAFTAYALGLIGARAGDPAVRGYVVHHLGRAIDAEDQPTPDVAVAGVVAMGLVPLAGKDGPVRGAEGEVRPSTCRQAQIRFLLDRLGEDSLDERVRAQIPVALARLADGLEPSPKDELVGVFAHALERGDTPKGVRQGLVQALGRLGDDDDDPADRVVRAALRHAATEGDLLSRSLALVALGRAAGRPGSGSPGNGPLEERAFLVMTLGRGSSAARPWASLALGLMERERAAAGLPPSEGVREALGRALTSGKSPLEAGAHAIASGLARDPEATAALVERCAGGDERLRAHAAIGLALLGASDAIAPLRELAADARYRPLLLHESAIALALLGHKEAVETLVQRLERSTERLEQVAAANALGAIGDARTVEPLLALLGDASKPATTRAYAAVALGRVCDKERLPWSTKLALDVVWWEAPSTLFDPISREGVLDLF